MAEDSCTRASGRELLDRIAGAALSGGQVTLLLNHRGLCTILETSCGAGCAAVASANEKQPRFTEVLDELRRIAEACRRHACCRPKGRVAVIYFGVDGLARILLEECAEDVVEVYGSLTQLRCPACGLTVNLLKERSQMVQPRCPVCNVGMIPLPLVLEDGPAPSLLRRALVHVTSSDVVVASLYPATLLELSLILVASKFAETYLVPEDGSEPPAQPIMAAGAKLASGLSLLDVVESLGLFCRTSALPRQGEERS
ncbi:MAG: hypothetical protein ABWW70_04075 [Thermoproteota archaeon]